MLAARFRHLVVGLRRCFSLGEAVTNGISMRPASGSIITVQQRLKDFRHASDDLATESPRPTQEAGRRGL